MSSAPASRPLMRSSTELAEESNTTGASGQRDCKWRQIIGAGHAQAGFRSRRNQIEKALLAKISRSGPPGGGELYSEVFLLQPGLEEFRQRRCRLSATKKAHGRSLRTNFLGRG